jgi:tetratricopeptide (TPR) repeat protein
VRISKKFNVCASGSNIIGEARGTVRDAPSRWPLPRQLAASSLAALLVLALAGCQSSTPAGKSKRASSSATLADAKAQDAFESGAGKPPTPATMYALARILTAKGDTSQAIATLRNLIQRYPNYAPAYNALAEAYLSVDRTDDAISALTVGVTRVQKDPILLNNLGMAYFVAGDYESALANFDRAVALAPGEPLYTSNKATALGMLGRVTESAALYRKHLRKSDAFENIDIVMRARKAEAAENAPAPREADAVDVVRPATRPSASAVGAAGTSVSVPAQ